MAAKGTQGQTGSGHSRLVSCQEEQRVTGRTSTSPGPAFWQRQVHCSKLQQNGRQLAEFQAVRFEPHFPHEALLLPLKNPDQQLAQSLLKHANIKRIILVCQNFCLTFKVLSSISPGNSIVVLPKLAAKMWECSNVSKRKSNMVTNKRSDIQVLKKHQGQPKIFKGKTKSDYD